MLDGYDYLVKQGWEGKGSALRPGGLRRPIIVSQKKTLAGVGEGRDEAFPFWEHIFNVSVNAVKIKVSSDSATDSDAEEKKDSTNAAPRFQRTATGAISHLRPIYGTPAYEEVRVSPILNTPPSARLSLLATAKRELARRQLYTLFYRGPVIGAPESNPIFSSQPEAAAVEAAHPAQFVPSVDNSVIIETQHLGGKRKSKECTRNTDQSSGFNPTTETVTIDAGLSSVGARQGNDPKATKRAEKERRKLEKDGKKSSKPREKVAPRDSTLSLSQGGEPEISVSDKKLGHKKGKRRKDEIDHRLTTISAERGEKKRRKKG